MKALLKSFVLMLAMVTTIVLLAPDAEARRLGGGRSMGKSSGSIFKRTPTKPTANAAANKPGNAAATSGARRGGLMGPIAGLAAGLGLAALASYLGFGEELANMIMIALLIGGAIILIRMLLRRFGTTGLAGRTATAGAGANGVSGGLSRRSALPGSASAGTPNYGSSGGSFSSLTPADNARDAAATTADVPADFDVDTFVRQAKVQFVRLQAVYDVGDLIDLREFTSPEMFAELKLEIGERGISKNQTDVVTLDAELLGVHSDAQMHTAAVHFTGMIREEVDAAAEPFSETWTLTKPVDGSTGWVLAGIEQVDS